MNTHSSDTLNRTPQNALWPVENVLALLLTAAKLALSI